AVDGVDLDVPARGCLGLVGESGSGKSLTALAILRLAPTDRARVAGRIGFQGRDLLALPASALPDIRGRDIAMIFQEPMSSLNPVMTIGDQIGEA
ncbi:ATP-binding cassette domain-containing protein, partial [Klebsiella pneumoniae]